MRPRITHACLLIAVVSFCSFAQSKNDEQVIEIPFDFYRNEIILQVKVDEKGPYSMMLDTGTNPSAIDLDTAKALGLKLDSTGRQGTGGGTETNLSYVTKLPLVEVGSLSAKSVWAVAINLSKVSTRLGKPLHGVLGHSLLNGRIVRIDYPNRTIRFYPASSIAKTAKQPNTAKRTVLPFRYNEDVLIEDVFVNGKKVVADLDTGSNGSFALTPDAVALLGLEAEVSRAKVTTDVGYNGVSENREGQVSNITIGGISIDAPTVTFFGKGTGRDKRPWGLNIGNVFLKDFVVTIDYKSKLITLERP